MPGPWWEWAITVLLGGTLTAVIGAWIWLDWEELRALPARLTAWLDGIAARLEQPEECACRAGGKPLAIQAWELGDTLETGATGPVIDHRCPTCWLPRTPPPRPPSGPGGGSRHPQVASASRNGVTYTPAVGITHPTTLTEVRAEFDRLSSYRDHTEEQIARMEYLADLVDQMTAVQPPATGGVRFGGERQATYWPDPKSTRPWVARLNDGTTTYHGTEEEAKAWILSTRDPKTRPDDLASHDVPKA